LLDTGRWEGELIHTKRDGARVVVASRWSLQRDERGNPAAILETNNDITERRWAEEGLRERERRYRYIFQAVGVSIWEEDFSQVKADVDELKARGVSDFRRYFAEHPEFVRRAMTMVKVVDVNDATVKLFGGRSKDELLGSLDKVFLPETEEVFAGELLVLAEGKTFFEAETALQTLHGERLAVLFTITFPPEPAKLDSVLVTIMDITERKRAEEALQKAQAELAHVTRVTTMGELTSSIAHEVNQPLTAIVTNANAALRWLAGQPPNLEEVRETVGRIVRDGHRASEVVGRVRALFKKTATDKSRLDVNDLIQDSVAIVPREVRKNRVLLRTELTDDLPHVLGDRVQLQQVLLNLIINGIEAMSTVTGRPRELLVRTQRDESDWVIVSVRDSGVGIDPQNTDRLFDAFFTTKAEGMGMGLSVSRSIIEAHGGRLWAESNGGHGATLQFTLPADGGERHV
jgi:PAS domain S-box-containing protein